MLDNIDLLNWRDIAIYQRLSESFIEKHLDKTQLAMDIDRPKTVV